MSSKLGSHRESKWPSRIFWMLMLAGTAQVRALRADTPGLADEDAEQVQQELDAEAKVAEHGIEALAGTLSHAEVDIKPIKGTFQIGKLLDKPGAGMKETLKIWHSPPADEDASPVPAPWFEAKMRGKDPAYADQFVNTLTSRLAVFGFDKVLASATAEGAEVTLTSIRFPMNASNSSNCTESFEIFAKHIHHVEISSEHVDVDFVGMLKEHSDKLILQEMYKGLRTSIDAGLTPALEGASLDLISPPENRTHQELLLNLFAGLFFNVRVEYNSPAMADYLHSLPGLNVTAEDIIKSYKLMGEAFPTFLRGHPVFVMFLDLLQEADDCLETLDSLEVHGLPAGVRASMTWENINPWAFFNTLVKEAGLDKILRNETNETNKTIDFSHSEDVDIRAIRQAGVADEEIKQREAMAKVEVVEEIVEETEAVEKEIEAVGGALAGTQVDIRPVKGSFQVGGGLLSDKLGTNTKETISIWHETAAVADGNVAASPWIEVKIAAKNPTLGAKFVKTLTTRLAEVGLDVFLPNATAEGQEVTLISTIFPMSSNATQAFETFAKHVHHVELTSESMQVDFAGLLKNHSDKLILQEMYKGLRTSIDAGLTPAVEDEAIELLVRPENRSHFKLMVSMLAGLYFDIRLGYNSQALEGILESTPGLNISAEGLIEQYTMLGQGVPMWQRGLPVNLMALDVLQEAEDCLAALKSLEVKGLPAGVRAVVKFEGEHLDPWVFMNTLLKESGLDKILRNETGCSTCTR